MKRLLAVVLVSLSLAMPSFVVGQHHGGRHHSSSSSSRSSRKSHKAGSNDGTYQGGTGSSHKSGKYKNKNTGDLTGTAKAER